MRNPTNSLFIFESSFIKYLIVQLKTKGCLKFMNNKKGSATWKVYKEHISKSKDYNLKPQKIFDFGKFKRNSYLKRKRMNLPLIMD